MSSLKSAIRDFIDTSKLEADIDDEEDSLYCRLYITIKDQSIRVMLVANEKYRAPILDVLLVLPIKAKRTCRDETLRLINHINFEEGMNNLVMDPRDGEIILRHRFPCGGIEANHSFIDYLMTGLCQRTDEWYEALLRVAILGESMDDVLKSGSEAMTKTPENALPSPTVEGQVGHA